MSIFKKWFGSKKEESKVYTHDNFWSWFVANDKTFHTVLKDRNNVEKNFLRHVMTRMEMIHPGLFALSGMADDETAELIITADSQIKNIVFAEELITSAQALNGWKFTALKQPQSVEDVNITMKGYTFNQNNIFFSSNDHSGFPDQIDITVVYPSFVEEDRQTIIKGIFVFLEILLGELHLVTAIDQLHIVGKEENEGAELTSISKLKDFILWRQKEFIEKYEGIKSHTETDQYLSMEAELENGLPLVAIFNSDLLKWDRKPSHPWILAIEFIFEGIHDNGMPDEETYQALQNIEDNIMSELKDFDGYLNLGRVTADGSRELYFACRDFRLPSKVMHRVLSQHSDNLEILFDIYKDKYWQTLDRFM